MRQLPFRWSQVPVFEAVATARLDYANQSKDEAVEQEARNQAAVRLKSGLVPGTE